MHKLNYYAKEIHQTAVEKGFWKHNPNFPEKIALCHSELSECWEEHRYKRNNTSYDILRELVDCAVRILDLMEGFGFPLNESILQSKPERLEDHKNLLLDVHLWVSSALEEDRKNRSPSDALSKALQYIIHYIGENFYTILEEVIKTNKKRVYRHDKAY